jgi:transposase
MGERRVRKWANRFVREGPSGLRFRNRPGRPPVFTPEVAIHLVRIACELPDTLGVSPSQWDCVELAGRLVAEEVVASISAQSVGRILSRHRLMPWRHHL